MLHQMPLRPREVLVRTMAAGILARVKRVPTREGGRVFPRPEKAPAVVISTHMKSWERLRIFKY